MPRTKKSATKQKPPAPPSGHEDASEFDRAPSQKNLQRDPVKAANETRDVPTKHGIIK